MHSLLGGLVVKFTVLVAGIMVSKGEKVNKCIVQTRSEGRIGGDHPGKIHGLSMRYLSFGYFGRTGHQKMLVSVLI